VQHFKDVFGDQLFTKTADGPLLSPNDLKRRFIISTKSTKETEEGVKGAKKPPTDLPPVKEGIVQGEEPDEDRGEDHNPGSIFRQSFTRTVFEWLMEEGVKGARYSFRTDLPSVQPQSVV
jgi:hypothetical protein